jgi:SET domain-containing protein
MLVVPTELRPSGIHGIGVFFLAPVKKGELIWRFDSRIDRVYSNEEFSALPETIKPYMRLYAHWHKTSNVWMLCGDYANFINHCDKNPTNFCPGGGPFSDDIAAYDIEAGSEMTSDYKTICDYTLDTGNFSLP